MFAACGCSERASADDVESQEIMPDSSTDKPLSKCPFAKLARALQGEPEPTTSLTTIPIKASKEDRICPMTGAIGYCPMARPKGGKLAPEKLPELKVMMLLLWEDGANKVSVGVYPHMSKHWTALDLPDTSTKNEIKAKFRSLSIKFHPDKNHAEGAKDRFQEINEAYEALKEVDGQLAFPWDQYPDRQIASDGKEALKTFGPLAKEAAGTDPIKAQMMQHVVREATEAKTLIFERETERDGAVISEVWADGLCVDTRNGSNHLVKVYRRIVNPVRETTGSTEVPSVD